MAKFFDIIPPQSKKTVSKPKNQKDAWGWFFLIIFIVLLYVVLMKNIPVNSYQTSQSSEPKTNNSFELFGNNSTNINDHEVSNKIRLLDTTGRTDTIDNMKKLLENNGYVIEQTSVLSNQSDTTIIYYRNGQIEEATKLRDIFQLNIPSIKIKIEESETLGQSYEFLIILGQVE